MLTEKVAAEKAQETREALKVIGHLDYPPDVPITCEHCADNDTCEYRFDPYNTNDDCLAEK